MSVSGRGRDLFQQKFDVCSDSNGLGWVELQKDNFCALCQMSLVFFILLSADVWISVNYCEQVYERHFKKSKYVYVAKQFTHAIFKADQAHT